MEDELSEEETNDILEQTEKTTAADKDSSSGAGAVSQAEIDALLTAYQSVNATAAKKANDARDREVRPYDFTRPGRFSKEHLRTLSVIHSNFATALAAALPGIYHSPTRVDLVGLDQLTYKEYRESIPSKTMFAVIGGEPLTSDIFFELNPSIVGAWVDYLCGGIDVAATEPSELTPIDLAMAKTVFQACLRDYADCWSDTVALRPEIRRVVDSGSAGQLLLPSESVLVCSFEVRVGNSVGMMTICIPSTSVESLLPALRVNSAQLSGAREDSAAIEGLRKVLKQVSLPVKVILGGVKVTLADVAGLEIGDVIKTTRRADSEAELWIGDRRMFDCRPGIRGKSLAVLVSGVPEPVDGSTAADVSPATEEDSIQNAA